MAQIIIVILIIIFTTTFAWADYEKGLAALKKGEYEIALRVLEPLAEKGDVRAQTTLGYMYAAGDGVTQNYFIALKWLRMAAEQNYVQAQVNIGLIILRPSFIATPEEYAEAFKWFRKAANCSGQPNPDTLLRPFSYSIGVRYPSVECNRTLS